MQANRCCINPLLIMRTTLLLGSLLALSLLGCDDSHNLDAIVARPSPAVTVSAFEVKLVNQTSTAATYFGTLEPKERRMMRFESSGSVGVIAKRGDSFSEGELLAELGDAADEQQKTLIESNLQLARANGQIARVQQLEQQLADLERELDNKQIIAPFAGVVLEVFAEVGSQLNPRSPVIQIADTSDPLVKINLPLRIAQWATPEMSINFVIDGQPIQGTLDSKSARQDPAGTSTVWFKLDQTMTTGGWTFGQSVESRFRFDEPDSGFWLPLDAVQRAGPGLWSVLVVEQSTEQSAGDEELRKLSKRIVSVKKFIDDRVLVEGELKDGELVVANGRHRVVPNQQVKVQPWTFMVADQSGGSP